MLEDLNRALDVVFGAAGLRSLDDGNVAARVPEALRVPSMERFEAWPESYRRDALPPGAPVGAVEAGTTRGWHHLIGDDEVVIGLDRFGLSGPGEGVYEELGFTVDRIIDAIREAPEPASGRATTA